MKDRCSQPNDVGGFAHYGRVQAALVWKRRDIVARGLVGMRAGVVCIISPVCFISQMPVNLQQGADLIVAACNLLECDRKAGQQIEQPGLAEEDRHPRVEHGCVEVAEGRLKGGV